MFSLDAVGPLSVLQWGAKESSFTPRQRTQQTLGNGSIAVPAAERYGEQDLLMRRDRISRLADRRRLYTNETYDQARSQLRAGQPPIPAPSGEQLRFEADLFHQILDSRYDFTAYPFGIRRVRPGIDTIELEVESEKRAHEILRTILPSYEPDGEVHGMPGLRIWQRTKNGIEIHQSGRATSAWLTGLPASVWKRAEADALDTILSELAWRPLWKGPDRWSEEELGFEQQWNMGEWSRNFQAGAWCTSGLLRRVALFHTIVPADYVGGYRGLGIRGYEGLGPVRWCLDLDHRTGVKYRKQELVDALTDPEFGLPVAQAHHLDAIYPPHEFGNWIRLDDEARTGLIELRFTTFNYPSLQQKTDPQYRAIVETIQTRVDAVLASG
ncbi:hypothetical protein [Streptomyces sp. NPDC058614]|uniref:hypothetical protein n=1 Tax=Streptomyces sp. NPDC058614 TaxID=3346557 RepID=UPI00365326F0